MDKDVEKHCKSCYGCHLVAIQMNSEPLHITQDSVTITTMVRFGYWLLRTIAMRGYIMCTGGLLFFKRDGCDHHEISNN